MLKKIVLSGILMACMGGFGLHDVQGTVSPGWDMHVIGQQNSPIYLYVEDIDGDGDLDVAATSDVHPDGANSEVAWYRNNMKQGLPWNKFIISSDDPNTNPIYGAAGIIMSDIDGDGHKDAVVVTGNVVYPWGDVYWLKAPEDPATGPWQRFTLETEVADSYYKVYTMDANRDGKQDIVIGGNRGAVLFLNPGNPDQPGAVWTKVPLPEKTGSSIYLDDMNNDGKIDVVNSYTGLSSMGYVGNVSWLDVTDAGGQIGFNRTIIDPDSVRAFDVNTLDVNEDGEKDVVVSTLMKPGIYWYEQPANSGDSWIQHFVSNTFKGTDMYTGDIDKNGKTDLIISGAFSNKISWFSYSWENGQALWMEHSLDDNISQPGDISLNDVDGDGDLDVVVTSLVSNQVLWYENRLNELTTTTSTTTIPATTTTLPVTTTTTVPATIIKLSSFAAIPKSGKIILEWTTESEIDNVGFNLYRSETENGQYTKTNASLIPAQGSASQGVSYEFVDKDVKNRKTYYYKLEDIDLNGISTMHGPVSATPRLIYAIGK
jgi:hypothetical protein